MRYGTTVASVVLALTFVAWAAGPAAPAGGDKDVRTKAGPAGGNGGDAFLDKRLPQGARVVGVKIRHGDYIDAVELLYKAADGNIESLGRHGTEGGEESIFMLDKDEYIKGITGTTGDYLVTLTIVTNKRKSEKYGGAAGDGANKFNLVTPDVEVVGFYGRAGAFVDQIGIFLHKRP
jgi:hypothetical protein